MKNSKPRTAAAEEERFNAKTRREIEEALEDAKHGRNLSPAFDNASDAIVYLKSGQEAR